MGDRVLFMPALPLMPSAQQGQAASLKAETARKRKWYVKRKTKQALLLGLCACSLAAGCPKSLLIIKLAAIVDELSLVVNGVPGSRKLS